MYIKRFSTSLKREKTIDSMQVGDKSSKIQKKKTRGEYANIVLVYSLLY